MNDHVEADAGLVMCSCGLAMYAVENGGPWTYVCEDCDPELMHLVRLG